MSVEDFYKSFACRSEVHCDACRTSAKWRVAIGETYGMDGEFPWLCRKEAKGIEPLPGLTKECAIPKIIHFVWVQGQPPRYVQEVMAYWQKMNPAYQMMLHDSTKVFPERRALFDAMPGMDMKADIIRLCALKTYGGWYVDTDFMPLATIDEIASSFPPFDFFCVRHHRGRLGNGFMACTTGARVWPRIEAYLDTVTPARRVACGPDLLEAVKYSGALTIPSIASFFPNSAKEGAPAISLANRLLRGESPESIRKLLTCCGNAPPLAFHIGLGGKDRDWRSRPVLPFVHGAASRLTAPILLNSPDFVYLSRPHKTALHDGKDGNLVLWGSHRTKALFTDANTLFLENGLINQRRGFMVDTRGFFSESVIRRTRAWEKAPNEQEWKEVERGLHGLGWSFDQQHDPAGPIVVALQRRGDAGAFVYFPLGRRKDSLEELLRACAKHLPARPVVIRLHPVYQEEFAEKEAHYRSLFRPDWTVHSGGNVYQLIAKASALVTINSTLATEAQALTIPIATLGLGSWTGSGTTLECFRDPSRLAGLLDWKPDMPRRRAYLAAVQRYQVPYTEPARLQQHPEYLAWAGRLK